MTTNTNDAVAAIIRTFGAELHDPGESLSLLVRFKVDESDEGRVAAAFAAAKPRTLKEPGCVAFHLSRDPRDPGRFTVFEQWRNLADLEAHLRTDYITKLRAEFDALIIGVPEFQVLLPAA
jgi:quinol monooxygenase YgiN